MFHSTGKPTIAKFRTRCSHIWEAADTGLDLAQRWNPKGRNAHLQRELIRCFKAYKDSADALLEMMNGRAGGSY